MVVARLGYVWVPACVSCHCLFFSYLVAALKQGSMTLPRRYSQDSQDGTLERLKVTSSCTVWILQMLNWNVHTQRSPKLKLLRLLSFCAKHSVSLNLFCIIFGRHREERVITSRKLNLWNHGIGLHIQKPHGEKCSLAKNQLLVQIGGEIKATLFSNDSI